MTELVKVLALDGGGIRGVIPAMLLAEIESRTSRPISESFDLIAGTSTGGILALGLVKPNAEGKPAYRAGQLVDLNAKEGHRIFSRSVWHRTRAFGSAIEEKYPAEELEEVLDQYFEETMLSAALTDVLVTAYEIETRMPWFFRSRNAKEKPEFDFPMKQVARATTAAPTFFTPARLTTDANPDYWALIDGSVFANNPAMCAVAEVLSLRHDAELLVVSLGTGVQNRRIEYEEAKDWGMFAWARPILNIVLSGVSETIDYQVKQLCQAQEAQPRRYFRFQKALDLASDDIDEASPRNIHALKLEAEQLIEAETEALDELVAQLVPTRAPAGSK